MKKELICFDLDNTLIDSDRIHVTAFNYSFRKNGLPKVDPKRLVMLFGMGVNKFVRMLFPDLTDAEVKRVVRDHDRKVVTDTCRYAKTFKGVKPALERLKGHYKLAVLSNIKLAEIKATLKIVGIPLSDFDVLIGSDGVKNPKPSPEAIKLAMRQSGIRKGYMVGDTIYDIQAGKAAGLRTVAVLTGHHSRYRLKKENPDYILKSVAGLPELLLD